MANVFILPLPIPHPTPRRAWNKKVIKVERMRCMLVRIYLFRCRSPVFFCYAHLAC